MLSHTEYQRTNPKQTLSLLLYLVSSNKQYNKYSNLNRCFGVLDFFSSMCQAEVRKGKLGSAVLCMEKLWYFYQHNLLSEKMSIFIQPVFRIGLKSAFLNICVDLKRSSVSINAFWTGEEHLSSITVTFS